MPRRIIPYRTPFVFPLLYPSLVWRIPSAEKKIYLTFDDGPVPGPTEAVVEILRKAFCTATFFCIGDNILKYPEVFQLIMAGRHSVGNHTFNHLNGWKTPAKEYLSNVTLCDREIDKHVSRMPGSRRLFRPPYGKITYSQIRSMPDHKIVMWDVLSMDFDKSISPETVLKKTIAATRDGSIIVFHDSFKAERNMMYAVPRLIDHFAGKGYRFESIGV